MKKSMEVVLVLFISVLYLFTYWIVIYIGIDKILFELSRNYIYFASAKVVYDMFLINIVVSLILAQIITALNVVLFTKRRRAFYLMNLGHIPILLLIWYLIYGSDSVIPFINNWHVSLF